jgi:hypothetical protein
MGSHLVANAAAAPDYDPFTITGCGGDPKARACASRSIPKTKTVAPASAITNANAITDAAADLWRAAQSLWL